MTNPISPEEVEKMITSRRPVYKQVKVTMPHCPVCKEQLGGNGSGILPFSCSCGEWEIDWTTGYFKIKVKSL